MNITTITTIQIYTNKLIKKYNYISKVLVKSCCCPGVEEVVTLGCYCCNNNHIYNSSVIYEYNYIITTITTIQIYTNKLIKKYNYIS